MQSLVRLLPLMLISPLALAQTPAPQMPPGFVHPPVGNHAQPASEPGKVQPYRLPADLYATPRMGGNMMGHGSDPHAGGGAMPLTPEQQMPHVGTVLTALDGGGYSYLEVEGEQGKQWLAAPAFRVKVGDRVRFQDGSMMSNFSSRALNRTFPSILFVGGAMVMAGDTPAQ